MIARRRENFRNSRARRQMSEKYSFMALPSGSEYGDRFKTYFCLLILFEINLKQRYDKAFTVTGNISGWSTKKWHVKYTLLHMYNFALRKTARHRYRTYRMRRMHRMYRMAGGVCDVQKIGTIRYRTVATASASINFCVGLFSFFSPPSNPFVSPTIMCNEKTFRI